MQRTAKHQTADTAGDGETFEASRIVRRLHHRRRRLARSVLALVVPALFVFARVVLARVVLAPFVVSEESSGPGSESPVIWSTTAVLFFPPV